MGRIGITSRGLEAILDTTHIMCLMDTYIYPENSISDTFICLKLVFWINCPKIFKFGTNCTSDRQEVIQTERGFGGRRGVGKETISVYVAWWVPSVYRTFDHFPIISIKVVSPDKIGKSASSAIWYCERALSYAPCSSL